MNTTALRVLKISFILCVAGSARQAMSADSSSDTAESGAAQITGPATGEEPYIKRGYYDLAFSGGLARYHYNGGSTSGSVSADLGYYVSSRILMGAGIGFSASSASPGMWAPSGRVHFRYLIPTRNPRAFIFFGAEPEGRYLHRQLYGSSSTSQFLLTSEAGLKYFVARNVSVETAYNLAYIHQYGLFDYDQWTSMIVTGLAFTFGR